MLFYPNWRVSYKGAGLGVAKEKLAVPNVFRLVRGLLRCILRTCSPFRWHVSQAIALSAKRVIHLLDPLGKLFYGALLDVNKSPPVPPAFAHGCFKGRRRETPMMVQMNLTWRLKQLDLWHITDLKDISNAFHSTGHAYVQEASSMLLLPQHAHLGVERFEWATVVVPGARGPLTVHPRCGALIGGPYAVALFCNDINGPFEEAWKEFVGDELGPLRAMLPELDLEQDMGFQS